MLMRSIRSSGFNDTSRGGFGQARNPMPWRGVLEQRSFADELREEPAPPRGDHGDPRARANWARRVAQVVRRGDRAAAVGGGGVGQGRNEGKSADRENWRLRVTGDGSLGSARPLCCRSPAYRP